MNIGIFTDTYYPQINGVVTSTRMLEKELNKLGHQVFIITTTNPEVTHAAPRVFRLPSMPFIFFPTQRVTFLYSPKLLVKLKSLKLDIVHTQTEFPVGIFGKIVSEFYRIPMVHTYHTMYEDYVHYIANGHLITPKIAQKFSRLFCNRADIVIAPVRKTKEYLEGIGVSRPLRVIPTGLDFSPFLKENFSREQINLVKSELGISPTDPVIVTIGRVAKEKSIDVLIDQMSRLRERLPNVKLVVVGPGPYLDILKEQAERLSVTDMVIFTGGRPWEVIPLYYQIGDVFAMASTSETQGLTYIEALAGKVPVVVKRDRSVEGVISHGETGYCFERDSEAADLLYRALTERDEAKKMAEEGFKRISHLSAAHFAKQVQQVYNEALSMKPKHKRSINWSLAFGRRPKEDTDEFEPSVEAE
ncbi:MAG: glycosyltransferase family 4 protein [Clostridiales bacterium]|jgi:1,2-diacylglycerol 3-alpha-glucosyltransferase|nr:glycosyltransferase family 4 protein [Clostridiales bacterium]